MSDQEYKSPPIDEVLISVHFATLPKFQMMAVGELWQASKDKFPKIEEQSPVIQTVEQFGKPPGDQVIEFPTDYRRFWLVNDDGTQLIQLQRDFFSVNWRKVSGDEIYTGFENTVRPLFAEKWDQFVKQTASSGIGEVKPIQCEVTYINLIPKGQGWENQGDISGIICPWSGTLDCNDLPAPERVAMQITFLRPDAKGRITVSVNPGVRKKDDVEIVRLAISSRVVIEGASPEDMLVHVDGAHDWAKRVFRGITDPAARKIWGAQ